jgi:hypothetical protein
MNLQKQHKKTVRTFSVTTRSHHDISLLWKINFLKLSAPPPGPPRCTSIQESETKTVKGKPLFFLVSTKSHPDVSLVRNVPPFCRVVTISSVTKRHTETKSDISSVLIVKRWAKNELSLSKGGKNESKKKRFYPTYFLNSI